MSAKTLTPAFAVPFLIASLLGCSPSGTLGSSGLEGAESDASLEGRPPPGNAADRVSGTGSDVRDHLEGCVQPDEDGDGDHSIACGGLDCDDNDPLRNGLDADQDGFATCDAVADCDDADPYTNPGAPEACDARDNDCDGLVDRDDGDLEADADGDGHAAVGCALGGDDCDDRDPHVFPDYERTSGPIRHCRPVVYPGFSQQWHFARVSLPSHFADPVSHQHYVYFRGHEDQARQAIGVVAREDGGAWNQEPGPVLGPAPGSWDARNISNPSVVYVPGAARPYVMLYHGRDEVSGTRQIGLASATSPLGPFARLDPVAGTRAITSPVLPPSADPAALDSGRTLHPSARYDVGSGLIHLWYNGRTASDPTLRVFHATSADAGLTWLRTDVDGQPGPDVVFEPTKDWELSTVTQVSWLDGPDGRGPELEFWYTAGGAVIGAAAGTATDWGRLSETPAFEWADRCDRMDGAAVTARAIHHEPATDVYHWYYGARSDISGGDACVGNEDPVYANYGGSVSYVAEATNFAPVVTVEPQPVAVGTGLSLVGTVDDTAPERVEVRLELAGQTIALAEVGTSGPGTGGRATGPGPRETNWQALLPDLPPGDHEIQVVATDEAGVARSTGLMVHVD